MNNRLPWFYSLIGIMLAVMPVSGSTATARAAVLVIDNDQATCDQVSKLLALREYESRCIPTASGGLEAVHKGDFSGVVLNLQIPGMDGLTVIKALKESFPSLPLIVLTGSDAVTIQMMVDAFELGADAVVTKPYDNQELLGTIDHAMKRK